MFKDYYKLLGIQYSSTQSEIKNAFRKNAFKYHPDKNPNDDTTKIMQDICEAYLVLRNIDAKEKYDVEYTRYYSIYRTDNLISNDFTYEDPALKEIINDILTNILKYSKSLLKDSSQLAVVGAKAAGNKMLNVLISYIVIGVIISIIIQTCGGIN